MRTKAKLYTLFITVLLLATVFTSKYLRAASEYPSQMRIIEIRYLFNTSDIPQGNHPDLLSQALRNQLELASIYHGYENPQGQPVINIEVVDVVNHENSTRPWDPAWATLDPYTKAYNVFERILEEENLCERIANEDIDQIWIWVDPRPGHDEYNGFEYIISGNSILKGYQYATIANPPYCSGTSSFVMMGFDYTRPFENAMESFGHYLEGLLGTVESVELFWYRFGGNDSAGFPRSLRCGGVHYPPNGISDYDYTNQTFVTNSCQDWNPDSIGTTTDINCTTWNCNQPDYLTWWGQNFPNRFDRPTKYQDLIIPSWWEFLVDFDDFIASLLRGNSFISPQWLAANAIDRNLCRSDLNNNKSVEVGDISGILFDWEGSCDTNETACRSDVNQNGGVEIGDIAAVLYYWGQNCNY